MNANDENRQPATGKGGKKRITMALADYDRTRPIIDGRVQPEGVDVAVTTMPIVNFCIHRVFDEFDVAEMEMSWYVAARCRGEPIIALPIFLLRMAVLGYLFCRSDLPFTHPRELVGRRIGTWRYRFTVNHWLRGILQEHYGLAPSDVSWVTSEPEGGDFSVPPEIQLEIVEGKSTEQLLLAGEIDAMIGAVVPRSFLKGDPRIRRLFPDARAETRSLVKRTGIFPVTHGLVMRQSLAEKEPWLVDSLIEAFLKAQRLSDECNREPKRSSHPEAVFILEEQAAEYGPDAWVHGIEPNRKLLETYVRYAQEQGYISRRPAVDELFVKHTVPVAA